jgi:HEPN domain-containing protein
MTTELKVFVEEWLLKAERDIISAQRLLEIEPMILDNACFHCQQAVEKSLKAFLCYKEIEIVRTHDIYFLLGQCGLLIPSLEALIRKTLMITQCKHATPALC